MKSVNDHLVSVRRIGREQEPIVIIDDFSGAADALYDAAQTADYKEGGAYYPGIRAKADVSYLNRRRDVFVNVLQNIFGFTHSIAVESANFSIVTRPETDLAPLQRIPHYDQAGGEIIAVMHYLLGPGSGGTAFYRHRRTGFESITADREADYRAALAHDARTFGTPVARYCYGNTDWFEMIDEVEAKPDRLVLYRGRQLHSGVIPNPAALSANPGLGRVTINMFLVGQ